MGEIPADIMKAASACAASCSFGWQTSNTLLIASFILAERERCAKLCETTAMCVPYSGTVQTHGRYVPDEAIDAFHQGAGYAALIRDADFIRQKPQPGGN